MTAYRDRRKLVIGTTNKVRVENVEEIRVRVIDPVSKLIRRL